jgi:hypothetical protein
MPQYAEPWKHRILQSTLAAIRNYPDFPEGARLWDERVYHPDADGAIQPLARLWKFGGAPAYLQAVVVTVRMMGAGPVSSGLRMAWNDRVEMRATLGQL